MGPIEAEAGRIEIDRAARGATLSEGEAADVAVGLGMADERAEMIASRPGLDGGEIEAGLKAPEMAVELGRKGSAAAILGPFPEGAAPADRQRAILVRRLWSPWRS